MYFLLGLLIYGCGLEDWFLWFNWYLGRLPLTSCTTRGWQDGHGQDWPNGEKTCHQEGHQRRPSSRSSSCRNNQTKDSVWDIQTPLPIQPVIYMNEILKKRMRGGFALHFPLPQSMAAGGVLIYVSLDQSSRNIPSCSTDTAEAKGEMSNVIIQWMKGGRWRDQLEGGARHRGTVARWCSHTTKPYLSVYKSPAPVSSSQHN